MVRSVALPPNKVLEATTIGCWATIEETVDVVLTRGRRRKTWRDKRGLNGVRILGCVLCDNRKRQLRRVGQNWVEWNGENRVDRSGECERDGRKRHIARNQSWNRGRKTGRNWRYDNGGRRSSRRRHGFTGHGGLQASQRDELRLAIERDHVVERVDDFIDCPGAGPKALQFGRKAFAGERRVEHHLVVYGEGRVAVMRIVGTAVAVTSLVELVQDELARLDEALAERVDVVDNGRVCGPSKHRRLEHEVEGRSRDGAMDNFEGREAGGGVRTRVVRPGHEWQCDIPILLISTAALGQEVKQRGVEPFDEALRLGVIGGGEALVNAKLGADVLDQGVGKVAAPIADQGGRRPKAADDAVDEGFGNGRRVGVGGGHGFDPLGEVVGEDEDISVASGRDRERTQEIHDDDFAGVRGLERLEQTTRG